VSLHPQVVQLIERAAKSPLPPYYEVPAHIARRIYRDTRAVLSPKAPEVAEARLLLAPGPVALRGYRPQGTKPDEQLPALVYFHGGGWVIGDLDTHDVVCRTLANGTRCAVFSVEYRKAPESPFPAAVDDCFAALNFISRGERNFHINAKQLAVAGDSAGGNLAAVMALMARDAGGPSISFQVLIYPATDQRMGFASLERNGEGYLLTKKVMHYFRGHYLPEQGDWLDWRASPLLAKSLARLPAAYVLTAGFDPLVDEGKEYAERMRKEGVAVEYRNYPDMVHGFITMGRVLDTANAALADCARALRKAWGA
jgi:acetyl esterase